MITENAFDRSVCFTFYKNYLEQSEIVKERSGAEAGYDCLAGIVKYALFQEEPENIEAKMIVDCLKYNIDNNQAKRQRGFEGKWG